MEQLGKFLSNSGIRWVMSKPQEFCTIWCGITQLLQVQQASPGLFQKKSKQRGGGGGEDMESLGFPRKNQRNGICNFQGLIKKKVEFPRVTKKK